MPETIVREQGCPAISEKDLLLLTRGTLEESAAEDLFLLMAKFHSLFQRWSEYSSLNPNRSVEIRSRVAHFREELRTTEVDF